MEIHIGDRVADVTLVSKEGNKVQLTIDGVPYDVDIVMAENGSCSILHEGKSYNAELIIPSVIPFSLNASTLTYTVSPSTSAPMFCSAVKVMQL